MKLSAVVMTWNEERNIKRCLQSLSGLVDEIILVDMESTDNTVEIAKTFKAKVYSHPFVGYVEPARNVGFEKAKGEWIIVLDADEEVPDSLATKIKEIVATSSDISFYTIPRKTFTFNQWIKHGMWWPDYQIRLFKKGAVQWVNEVHGVPLTMGKGEDLAAKEEYALVHHNYQTISQYIERLNRYTSIQSKEKIKQQYRFKWNDLLERPFEEFLRRYFFSQGYKDGLHGLVLALLQSFSELVLYLKIWEEEQFKKVSEEHIKKEFEPTIRTMHKNLYHWLKEANFAHGIHVFLQKILS